MTSKGCEEQNWFKDMAVLVIQDKAAYLIWGQPAKTKSAADSVKGLQMLLADEEMKKAKLFYMDDGNELEKAAGHLRFRDDTSIPHHPQMNGIAEASVRRLKQCTAALLGQSGLEYKYWPCAMMARCCRHNFRDNIQEGPFKSVTPYKAE